MKKKNIMIRDLEDPEHESAYESLHNRLLKLSLMHGQLGMLKIIIEALADYGILKEDDLRVMLEINSTTEDLVITEE